MNPYQCQALQGNLFRKPMSRNFYNYCPSIIVDDSTLHIWYCTNKESKNITDFIGYRSAQWNGHNWQFTREKIVLSPTNNEWDSRHVCDPSIIKGTFSYLGQNYAYLMAYLGCVSDNCTDNEVGLALAMKPQGPWVKYQSNPFACFTQSALYQGPGIHWGFGQPCLLSLNQFGKVLLFYTVGTDHTWTVCETWEISNLDAPVKLQESIVPNTGYVNSLGKADVIGNADFCYDTKRNTLYAVSDMRVRGTFQPTYISDSFPVLEAHLADSNLFEHRFHLSFSWSTKVIINQAESGFVKNHNPGIVRNPYGHLPCEEEIVIAYTVSDYNHNHPRREGIWQSLHTYRIFFHSFPIRGES